MVPTLLFANLGLINQSKDGKIENNKNHNLEGNPKKMPEKAKKPQNAKPGLWIVEGLASLRPSRE